MDDPLLDPELKDDEEVEEDLDDVLSPGGKKPKKEVEDDSLDALAEDEDGALPEDAFDDTEPEDLW